MAKRSLLNKIKIRRMVIDDYDDVIALWQSAGLPFKPEGRDQKARVARELKKDTALFFVAEIDHKLIGSIFGTYDGRKGWINRLSVLPQYRRLGIGRRLVQVVEKELAKRNIEIIACLIEEWNERSMKAFERMGYKKHSDIFYFTKRKNSRV